MAHEAILGWDYHGWSYAKTGVFTWGTKTFLTKYEERMPGKTATIDAGCLMQTLHQLV